MTITHPGAASVLHNIINSIETTADKLKNYKVDQKQREDIREALREYILKKEGNKSNSIESRIALGFYQALDKPFMS